MESGFDNFYMNRRGLNSIHTAFSIFGVPFQNIPSKIHSHGILLIFDHFIFHRLGLSGQVFEQSLFLFFLLPPPPTPLPDGWWMGESRQKKKRGERKERVMEDRT